MAMDFTLEPMKAISRKEWGARKAKRKEKMKSRVSEMVLTWTETESCNDKEECTTRVKEIQNRHMDQEGEADIRYNFLVGGDGSIFEGRGWRVSPKVVGKGRKEKELKNMNRDSIYVACIGRKDSTPNTNMMMALVKINNMGVVKKHISEDFKLTKLEEEESEMEQEPKPKKKEKMKREKQLKKGKKF